MTTEVLQRNPYVGPRPFEPNDAPYFHGRNKEIKELTNLLIAERLVLLHSPSGAGKTSLLQAGIIPWLVQQEEQAEKESQDSEGEARAGFRVWPIIRVGKDPGRDLPPGDNRYIFSLLKSLEEKWPTDSLPVEKLAGMSLSQYREIRQNTFRSPGYDVFFFDQFEEILSLDPTDREVKKDFFAQLGEFLKPRERFALFAIKEEYLGALDPYLCYLPTQLSSAYRLEFLGKDAALAAIREPAKEAGGDFEENAAKQLMEDLRTVKVQKPSGEFGSEPGPVIDPLLLQVVCQGLWEQSPGGHIGIDELNKFRDVSQALAKYYRKKVGEIASQAAQGDADEAKKIERRIRDWFNNELTTPQGTVKKVWKEEAKGSSAGLENLLIKKLVDACLVREEQQRDIFWYELARFRLVEPVREDNDTWFRDTLSPLQRRAELWVRQNHPDDLLLTRDSLVLAEDWARSHQKQMTGEEHNFLAACRQKRRRTRIYLGLAVAIFILGLGMFMVGTYAIYQGRLAQARELSAAAVADLNLDPERSILLSLKAAEILGQGKAPGIEESIVLWARKIGEKLSPNDSPVLNEVEDALQRAVHASRARKVHRAHEGKVYDVAFSPTKDNIIATAGEDKAVKIWDVKTWKLIHPLPHTLEVRRVFFRPDGKQVLTVSAGQEARLWDPETGRPQYALKHDGIVLAAMYSGDGALVATASEDGTVKVWDSGTGAEAGSIPAQEGVKIFSVAFSPRDLYLATAGSDGVKIWVLMDILKQKSLDPQGTIEPLFRTPPEGLTDSLVFSPNGWRLASQDWKDDLAVLKVYDLDSQKSWKAEGSWKAKEYIETEPFFSPDGKQIAVGGKDLKILLYDSGTGKKVAELAGHTDNVFQITFLGPYLFSCSSDGTARLWDLKYKKEIVIFQGHTKPISRFAVQPKTRSLVTASWDGTVRVWNCGLFHQDRITGFAFSPTAGLLAANSRDGTLDLWDYASGRLLHWMEDLKNSGALAFDPSEKLLASVSGNVVYLWDAKTLEYQSSLENRGEVNNLCFSPDGRYLATGSYGGWGWRIWEFDKDMKLSSTEPLHTQFHRGALCVAFSPDSEILATGCSDNTVKLWSVATGKQLKEFPGHQGNVMSVAFSPKGDCLASASLDQTVKVWDLTPKQELLDPTVPLWKKKPFTIKKFNSRVDCVVFDRKGERLATVSRDLTARIFDARSRKELRTYHFSHVMDSVDFNPDNTELVIAGFDNELHYYPLDFTELQELAKSHLTRSLTKGELKRYHIKPTGKESN